MSIPRYIKQIVGIVVLLIFIVYFFANSSKFKPLLDVNIYLLFLIAIGDILGIFLNGLFTRFILQPFNKYISLAESFYVSLISSVGNFFAPVGAGFGFRAVYLKRKHDLPYSEYISTLSGNYIIVFLVNSFFGLLALYLLRAKSNHQYIVLLVTFAVVFSVSLVLSLVKIPLPKESKKKKYSTKIVKIFYQITHGWNHIISHKKLMLQLTSLTALNFLITMFNTWIIIKALHLSVGLAPLLLFSVLGSLSLFVNVTPANLGIKEAIYIFSSTVLGFSVAQILSIALIDRGVMFIILFVSWLAASKKRKQNTADLRPKTSS